jgi:formate/nitrite transporter FocA (FNT family)
MRIFETAKKMVGLGLVVASFIFIGFQMVVHGLFSELRDPMVVDTYWVGLASIQCLQPSQDGWVPVLNVVVQGSERVVQEMGL